MTDENNGSDDDAKHIIDRIINAREKRGEIGEQRIRGEDITDDQRREFAAIVADYAAVLRPYSDDVPPTTGASGHNKPIPQDDAMMALCIGADQIPTRLLPSVDGLLTMFMRLDDLAYDLGFTAQVAPHPERGDADYDEMPELDGDDELFDSGILSGDEALKRFKDG